MTSFRTSAVLAAGAMALAGCATVTNPNPADPIEGFNRSMYSFNDTLDKTVMTPVAKGYRFVVPEPARDMVTNFFSNIGDVYNFANNLLQLQVTAAVQDLMRLTINTVFGVGGLIDFASPAGLPNAGDVQERIAARYASGFRRSIVCTTMPPIEWPRITGRSSPPLLIANSTSSASASKLIAVTGSRPP